MPPEAKTVTAGASVVQIRPAGEDEGEQLREIAVAAKSHWGYDLDRVRQWAAAGDFSPRSLRHREIYVADVSGRPIGWMALQPRNDVCWLDDLWVEPAWIGKGIGSRLFDHAVRRALHLGATRVEWEAEPKAVGFYEKMGGRYVRDSEPNQWGRVIPVMAMELAELG